MAWICVGNSIWGYLLHYAKEGSSTRQGLPMKQSWDKLNRSPVKIVHNSGSEFLPTTMREIWVSVWIDVLIFLEPFSMDPYVVVFKYIIKEGKMNLTCQVLSKLKQDSYHGMPGSVQRHCLTSQYMKVEIVHTYTWVSETGKEKEDKKHLPGYC